MIQAWIFCGRCCCCHLADWVEALTGSCSAHYQLKKNKQTSNYLVLFWSTDSTGSDATHFIFALSLFPLRTRHRVPWWCTPGYFLWMCTIFTAVSNLCFPTDKLQNLSPIYTMCVWPWPLWKNMTSSTKLEELHILHCCRWQASHTQTHPFNALCPDYPGKPVPET